MENMRMCHMDCPKLAVCLKTNGTADILHIEVWQVTECASKVPLHGAPNLVPGTSVWCFIPKPTTLQVSNISALLLR